MAPTGRARWCRVAVVAAMAAQCRPTRTSSSEVALEIRIGTRDLAFTWSDGSTASWEATETRLSRAHEEDQQVPVRIIVVDPGVTMATLGGMLDWLQSHDAGDLVSLAVGDGSSGAAIRLTNRMQTHDPEVVCSQIELGDNGQRVKIDMYEFWRKQRSPLYDPRPTEQQMFGPREATPAEDASLPFERHEDLFVASGALADAAGSLGERVLARALTASHPCPRAALEVTRSLPWSRASVHLEILTALGVDELRLHIS